MNPLENLLEKFKSLLALQPQKKPILTCLAVVAGVTLTESDIDVKENIVYVRASPLVRNEIFMRRLAILNAFKESIGTQSLRDIR
jgi:hypothetical protein